MPTSRSGHICALVKNIHSGQAEIVAVGGWSSSVVEIFNVNTNSWRTGGKLLNSQQRSFDFTFIKCIPVILAAITNCTKTNVLASKYWTSNVYCIIKFLVGSELWHIKENTKL
jgi:hypothetical protein